MPMPDGFDLVRGFGFGCKWVAQTALASVGRCREGPCRAQLRVASSISLKDLLGPSTVGIAFSLIASIQGNGLG